VTNYLQRLVAPHADLAIRPVLASTSPIAEADQRLQVDDIADLVATAESGLPPTGAPPSRAAAPPPARPAGLREAPSAAAPAVPTVHRFMATPAGLAATTAPAPAPVGPTPQRIAASAPVAVPVMGGPAPSPVPDFDAPEPIIRYLTMTSPDRVPNPWPFAVAPGERLERIDVEPIAGPEPSRGMDEAPAPALPESAASVVPLSTVFKGMPEPPAPLPRPVRPAVPARPAFEIARAVPLPPDDDDHAAAPAPAREAIPVRHMVARERIQPAAPPPAPAMARERRGPTSAAEASVIGPLDRHDRSRVHLDLWLR